MDDRSILPRDLTREAWLLKGIAALRSLFLAANAPLPDVIHASIGFPSRGALSLRSRTIGQCWHGESSADGNAHIFVSPVHRTPLAALDTLAHELVHVVTPGAGHKGKFLTLAKQIGLTEGKPKSASAGPELLARLEGIMTDLGDVAFAPLDPKVLILPKQSTRMIKCECACGYVARTSQKWLDVGAPICPRCRTDMEPVHPEGV